MIFFKKMKRRESKRKINKSCFVELKNFYQKNFENDTICSIICGGGNIESC